MSEFWYIESSGIDKVQNWYEGSFLKFKQKKNVTAQVIAGISILTYVQIESQRKKNALNIYFIENDKQIDWILKNVHATYDHNFSLV